MRCADAETDAADAAVALASLNLRADAVDAVVIEAVADASFMRCADTDVLTATEAAAAASIMLPSYP